MKKFKIYGIDFIFISNTKEKLFFPLNQNKDIFILTETIYLDDDYIVQKVGKLQCLRFIRIHNRFRRVSKIAAIAHIELDNKSIDEVILCPNTKYVLSTNKAKIELIKERDLLE